MTLRIDDVEQTIHFREETCYDRDDLPDKLNEILPPSIRCDYDAGGTLTMQSDTEFSIVSMSHRVQLITGAYNSSFPVEGSIIVFESEPYLCYGNILFLRSRTSVVSGFNESESVVYRSVCYHVSEVFLPGIPIIARVPGAYTKINLNYLTHLEFTLVDFKNMPVVLRAPLHLVMEVDYDN